MKEHSEVKLKLNEYYEHITQGLILRSKANWYELGEKSNKYFLTLEKRKKCKTHIRKIKLENNNELTNPREILKNIGCFYETLYASKTEKTVADSVEFVSKVKIQKLDEVDMLRCEGYLTLNECFLGLRQMGNMKSPGSDGLTKEFYVAFWTILGNELVSCLNDCFDHGSLTTTQKQAIITLIEKSGKDCRYLKSWRPISLINVDAKICSKALSNRLIDILPNIIHPDQSAFVKSRNIEDPIRFLEDILEFYSQNNSSFVLFAADFEKAFDSIEHNFIFAVLQQFGFGASFINWIRMLLKDNQSCVVNNGSATGFFKTSRGTRQGDPISPYIFILVIEIMAQMVRDSLEIKGIEIAQSRKKILLFADDTTFFLQDNESLKAVIHLLNRFGKFSSLNINLEKSEAGWIGQMNGEKIEKPIKEIDFQKNGTKILGIFFSLDSGLRKQNNFDRVLESFKATLSIWRTRCLTLFGKVLAVRSLALSKLLYVSSKCHAPNNFIKSVEKEVVKFVWNGKKPKIKYKSLIENYERGGLKLPDLETLIKAHYMSLAIDMLKSSKPQKCWYIFPDQWLREIGGIKCIGENFDTSKIPVKLPFFYKNMLTIWADISVIPINDDPYTVLRQPLWNNRYITSLDIKYFRRFIEKGIVHVADMWSAKDGFHWQVALDFGLDDGDFLCWASIIHALPQQWKMILKPHQHNINKGLLVFDNVFLNGTSYDCNKLKSKGLYDILLTKKAKRPTAQLHISRRLAVNDINWKSVYARIYKTTIESYLRCFQYKILNNCLYLNKMLYRFKVVDSPRCSFCLFEMETIKHLFVECIHSKNYYISISNWLLKSNIILPPLNPLNIILGIEEGRDIKLTNFVLFVFKLMLYKARPSGKPPKIERFIQKMKYYYQVEHLIASKNDKITTHLRKWEKLIPSLNF